MKKIIVVEILLLFNLCICLQTDILYIMDFAHTGYYFNQHFILMLIVTITTIAAMILIAFNFKPLADKLKARNEAHKEARAQTKAEKAEADKQARIEQLQAELEELKKD